MSTSVASTLDYDNYTTRKWSAIPYLIILAISSVAVVGVRMWTRRIIQKQFGLEDYLILIGTITTLVILGGITLAIMYFGFDKHTWQLTPSQLVLAAEWLFVGEFAYVASVGSIKVGILLFYRRLSDRRAGVRFFYVIYFCITFIVVYKITYLSVILRTCVPLVARWRRLDLHWASTHHFTCINETANIFTGSTISATEDLVIALLPAGILWRLHLPIKQKIALWCIFGVSIFTAVAGYIRSYYIWEAGDPKDPIADQYWLWICSGIELCLGLICACAPAMKTFCVHYKLPTKLNALFKREDGLERAQASDTTLQNSADVPHHGDEQLYKVYPQTTSASENEITTFDHSTSASSSEDVSDVSIDQSPNLESYDHVIKIDDYESWSKPQPQDKVPAIYEYSQNMEQVHESNCDDDISTDRSSRLADNGHDDMKDIDASQCKLEVISGAI